MNLQWIFLHTVSYNKYLFTYLTLLTHYVILFNFLLLYDNYEYETVDNITFL